MEANYFVFNCPGCGPLPSAESWCNSLNFGGPHSVGLAPLGSGSLPARRLTVVNGLSIPECLNYANNLSA